LRKIKDGVDIDKMIEEAQKAPVEKVKKLRE
jgi:hypothetical protein